MGDPDGGDGDERDQSGQGQVAPTRARLDHGDSQGRGGQNGERSGQSAGPATGEDGADGPKAKRDRPRRA